MKHYAICIVLCGLLIFSSCASTNLIPVDFREPAAITLPPGIVNVTVADNSLLDKKARAEAKDLAATIYPTDSAQINLAKYLVKYMDEEKYFGQVIHYSNNRTEQDSTFFTLPAGEIEYICHETKSDALISVDDCILSGVMKEVAYMEDFYELSIGIYINIKTYDSNGGQLTAPRIFADTLRFSGFLHNPPGLEYLPVLPSVEEALDISASQVADRLTNLYVPHWKTQQRWYYSDSSSEMKKAAKHAAEYQWKEAAVIWGNLYEKEEKPIKKARLASNIALANECLEDIDNAFGWNQIAQDWMENGNNSVLKSQIKLQYQILTERKREVGKLKEQFGNE